MSNDVTNRVRREARTVEELLQKAGNPDAAYKVARLRRGYSRAIGLARALHAENAELRHQLGLPSFKGDGK